MFVLHGYSDDAASMRAMTGMDAVAQRYGFAVVYPRGTRDNAGHRFWQVGYAMHQQHMVDDEAFLVALAAELQQKHGFDARRTYLTGMSNGGDMALVMGCQHADVFAAIAPVVGTMMQAFVAAHPTPAGLPVLAFNGTADMVTRYDGDVTNQDGWGAYVSTPTVQALWQRANGCGAWQREVIGDPQQRDARQVVRLTAAGRHPLVWYELLDGGHDWPGRTDGHFVDASDVIGEFFAQMG